MTFNTVKNDQIQRFINNLSDTEEANRLSQYFLDRIEEFDQYMDYEEITELDLLRTLPYYKIEILNNIFTRENKIRSIKSILMVASVIIAIAIGCWSIIHYQQPSSSKTMLEQKYLVHVVNSNLDDISYQLPDGSLIQLKPNTEISYDSINFNNHRILHQHQGTGFYQVKSNPEYPFTVEANDILTTATGTKFSIENNLVKNQIIVHLINGVVTLNSRIEQFKMNNLPLYPGQTCTIDLANKTLQIEEKEITNPIKKNNGFTNSILKNELVWTNKEIILTKIKLRDLFYHLENHYSVKINFDEEALSQSTITGKIYYKDSLDTIIKSICEIAGLTYHKMQNQYFLKIKNEPLKIR